jgi:hypothetical protein
MTKLRFAFRNFANSPKNVAWNANYMARRTSKKDKRLCCINRRAFTASPVKIRFATLKSEGGRTWQCECVTTGTYRSESRSHKQIYF